MFSSLTHYWKGQNMYQKIYIITMLITMILFTFTLFFNQTVLSNNIMFNIRRYLQFNYGYINKNKLASLIPGVIILQTLLFKFLYTMTQSKIHKNRKIVTVSILLLLIIIVNLASLYYIPMHCSLGLCKYKKPTNYKSLEQLRQDKYICFIGSGDNQIFLDVLFPWFNKDEYTNARERSVNIVKNVNYINEIVDNLKNISLHVKQEHPFVFENNVVKQLVYHSAPNLIGYITAGDCTHKSLDGRYLSTNVVGVYEYYFNNNPEDGGLLKTSTYECMGNHDYLQEFSYSRKGEDYESEPRAFYYDNPTSKMIVRRNKYRKYIVHSDAYGNYSCQFGTLRVLFLNVWPMEESMKLYTGVPVNTLQYLREDLEKKPKDTPWIIVTHFVLNNRKDDDNPMSTFGEILKPYEHNFKGFLYGHVHQKYLVKKKKGYKKGENRYGNSYLMPAPAAIDNKNGPKCSWDQQLALFVYDQIEDELYALNVVKNIQTNKIHISLATTDTLPQEKELRQCFICTPKKRKRHITLTNCLHY